MSRKYTIIILTIALLFSLAGGVIGGIIFRSYLINSFFGIPLWGDINLTDNYQQGRIVISQPKKVVVEQNKRITESASIINASIVSFYIKKQQPANISEQNEINLKNYYFPEDKLGDGLVLTNDGWIVTVAKINKPASYVAVDKDGEILEVENAVFDSKSGFYFIKLKADNLVVAQFAEESGIQPGVLAVGLSQDGIKAFYLENVDYNPLKKALRSTENSYNMIKSEDGGARKGDICFNLEGKAIGLYSEEGIITPISYFSKLLPGLLREQKITRPFFGVNYIILNELKGERDLKGALITRAGSGVAVVKNSPAEKAGLKENDIILEVDGIEINKKNNLSDVILGYRPEEEIELLILRGKEEQVIKLELGELD